MEQGRNPSRRAMLRNAVRLVGAGLAVGLLPAHEARALLGPEAVIGWSTHDASQVEAALRTGAIDYLAYGPIFATASKANPDPVQGIAALAAVRPRVPLPLVAIGGITEATIADVRAAGADAVAVIGAIAGSDDPAAATRRLLARAA